MPGTLLERRALIEPPSEHTGGDELIRGRPEDLVNAIQQWEKEYKAHDTNFVSSHHFATARLHMIRWIADKRPDRIDVVRLHIRTNYIPRIRVVVPE